MTVAELIERLQELPQDVPAVGSMWFDERPGTWRIARVTVAEYELMTHTKVEDGERMAVMLVWNIGG